LVWAHSLRRKNLHQRSGLEKGAGYVRAVGDAAAILILRDEDDACPKARAPEMASWLRAMSLPFPSAIVLLHPESEVLFLPCLEQLAGKALEGPAGPRPGLMRGTQWTGPWEAKRGIKEWLSDHFPSGRAYKPTTDQLALTRMLDLSIVRAANV